jgi:hypothetical protein
MDPYEVLQVSPQASPEVIHAAYRALARGYHPDVNNGRESGHMRTLNAAYEMLRDPEMRTAYDARSRALRTQEIRQLQTRQRLPIEPPARHTPRPVAAPTVRPIVASGSRGGPSRTVLLTTIVVLVLVAVSLIMGSFVVSAALDDPSLTSSFDQLRDIGSAPREAPAQPYLNSR